MENSMNINDISVGKSYNFTHLSGRTPTEPVNIVQVGPANEFEAMAAELMFGKDDAKNIVKFKHADGDMGLGLAKEFSTLD
jgi:hypothetical protein